MINQEGDQISKSEAIIGSLRAQQEQGTIVIVDNFTLEPSRSPRRPTVTDRIIRIAPEPPISSSEELNKFAGNNLLTGLENVGRADALFHVGGEIISPATLTVFDRVPEGIERISIEVFSSMQNAQEANRII